MGTEGTILRRKSEPPRIVIVTLNCPDCGTRQQPEKPNGKYSRQEQSYNGLSENAPTSSVTSAATKS
jgi:hypothetical protein